jgi:hypothetical protein
MFKDIQNYQYVIEKLICVYIMQQQQQTYLRRVCWGEGGGGVAHCYVEVSGAFHASYTLLVGKETLVSCG